MHGATGDVMEKLEGGDVANEVEGRDTTDEGDRDEGSDVVNEGDKKVVLEHCDLAINGERGGGGLEGSVTWQMR